MENGNNMQREKVKKYCSNSLNKKKKEEKKKVIV